VTQWIAQRDGDKSMRPPTAAQGRKEAMLAQRVVEEWRTAVWLLEQNAKGIAVPSAALLRRYVLGWPRPLITPEAERHLSCIQRKRYTAKWLHFFRKRWDIKWKKLPARNPLPHDELRRKVPDNTWSVVPIMAGSCKPIFCTSTARFETISGALSVPNVGPFLGPFLGPKMVPLFGGKGFFFFLV
jgi:hypothetical protein